MSNIFPADWTVKPLEKIALQEKGSIVDGPFGSNLKTSDYVASGIPVLQGKNITNDKFKWFDVRYITETKAEELRRSSVRVGDILIVKIGSVGYSAIVDDLQGYEYAIIPANLLKISVNEKAFSTSFLHQYLTSPEGRKRLIDAASTTAQPALSLATVKQFSIPIPPLPEQQKIATILSSVDDVIEKTRAQIDKLKDLKTGMMQELLTKGTGHTEFKDSPVGRIPVGWNVVRLSEVITLNYGKSPKDIISESGSNSVWGTGGVTAKTDLFLYDGESIILGRKGTIDQPRYVSGKFWVIDTAYFSTNHGDNSVRFLHYLLQRINLKSLNEASGVPSLNRDTLYSVSVAMPTPSEQKDIADIVYSIEEKTLLMVNKNKALLKVKKALMQDLLTGKVRVNLTDKESAVV